MYLELQKFLDKEGRLLWSSPGPSSRGIYWLDPRHEKAFHQLMQLGVRLFKEQGDGHSPLKAGFIPALVKGPFLWLSVSVSAAVSVKTYSRRSRISFSYFAEDHDAAMGLRAFLDREKIPYTFAQGFGGILEFKVRCHDILTLAGLPDARGLRYRRNSGMKHIAYCHKSGGAVEKSGLDLVIVSPDVPRVLEPKARKKRSDVFQGEPLVIGYWHTGLYTV
jgi:hypothetical protein